MARVKFLVTDNDERNGTKPLKKFHKNFKGKSHFDG